MSEQKQYTEQEIIAMADECFPICNRCERYEPLPSFSEFRNTTVRKNVTLFNFVRSGCYYAHELPFASKRYCTFFGQKDGVDVKKVEILSSLTFDNVKKR